jgi:hypothetical protein
MAFKVPEKYRFKQPGHQLHSDESDGNNGAFYIPFGNDTLTVIASDGLGWEHVSVSLPYRTPSWLDMCYVKALFWDDEDVVIQYHPPKSQYINRHPHCLHMWRKAGENFETPPPHFVG